MRCSLFRAVVGVVLLTFSLSSNARRDCDSDHEDVEDFSKYIIQVTDYYESPPRVAVSSLPQTQQDLYKPTGELICKGAPGSAFDHQVWGYTAQLTVKNNLITTSGHAFYDQDTCQLKSRPQDCSFVIKTHGAVKSIPLADKVDLGLHCPESIATEDDWAVMKLSMAVDDIQPYQVDSIKAASLKNGDDVVTVAHSVDFQPPAKKGLGPLHYGECKILKTYGDGSTASVSTACGCGYGCSGGSLLTAAANPALLGVEVQTFESPADSDKAIKSGTPNVVHWQEDGAGTYYVTIGGKFLSAIRQGSL